MRKIILVAILIVGIVSTYSFAMMHDSTRGSGMMGSGSAMMGSQEQQEPGETPDTGGNYPCQMMGSGMMGSGAGCGMMGSGYGGHMMGRGMMGSGAGCGMMGSGYGGHMMGRGMMGGYGMGPGMMGSGMGCGMMGHGYGGHMMGRGMMGGYGMGHGMMGSGYYGKQYQKFLDETVDLRREIHNKRFDYFEAVRNTDTERETILKMDKEIRALQDKLYEKSLK
jgi:hypothetical protein